MVLRYVLHIWISFYILIVSINKQTDCALNRGKGLGGTSNINTMNYFSGNAIDYNNWADITHDEAWSYPNVLKYFKKSEDYYGYYNPS